MKDVWKNRIRPTGANVCVEPISRERTTEGGIHLPDGSSQAGEKIQVGRVFALGPGDIDLQGITHPPDVDVGDEIYFVSAGTIQELNVEGHKFWCVNLRDVLIRLIPANNDDLV